MAQGAALSTFEERTKVSCFFLHFTHRAPARSLTHSTVTLRQIRGPLGHECKSPLGRHKNYASKALSFECTRKADFPQQIGWLVWPVKRVLCNQRLLVVSDFSESNPVCDLRTKEENISKTRHIWLNYSGFDLRNRVPLMRSLGSRQVVSTQLAIFIIAWKKFRNRSRLNCKKG